MTGREHLLADAGVAAVVKRATTDDHDARCGRPTRPGTGRTGT
jgi:hypothetical protein